MLTISYKENKQTKKKERKDITILEFVEIIG